MKLLSVLASLIAAILTGNAAESTPTPPLRVFCYNIRHGEGLDGKVDLGRIAQLIRDSGAHVAALQEVDRNMGRTQRVDLAKELARQLGWTAYFSPTSGQRMGANTATPCSPPSPCPRGRTPYFPWGGRRNPAAYSRPRSAFRNRKSKS